eukprot:Hpha_TRINITY_DN16913_c1_g3::TRINITY_DN16913_c1_g3_i1::g.52089::m.52089
MAEEGGLGGAAKASVVPESTEVTEEQQGALQGMRDLLLPPGMRAEDQYMPSEADSEGGRCWSCAVWTHRFIVAVSILGFLASVGTCCWFFIGTQVWDRATVALVWAGYCGFISLVLTAFMTGLHVHWYSVPEHQRRIVRIILMCPIYAVAGAVSLWLHHDAAQYIELVRDSYEAFVLFNFYNLIVAFLLVPDDGCVDDLPPPGRQRRKALKQVLDSLVAVDGKITIPHPPPLCCLAPLEVTMKTLAWADFLVLQFVVLKPLCALVAIVGKATDFYDEEAGLYDYHNAYPYLLITENLSVTIAFTCIFYLYLLVKHAVPLRCPETCPNVTSKFVAIKIVIFLCFWQGMAITFFVRMGWVHQTTHWSEAEVATGIQNFLVAVEMSIMSFVHQFVFTHKPYQKRTRLNPNVAAWDALLYDQREGKTGFFKQIHKWFAAVDLGDEETTAIPSRPTTRQGTALLSEGRPESRERAPTRGSVPAEAVVTAE